jgi:hypothetical protein
MQFNKEDQEAITSQRAAKLLSKDDRKAYPSLHRMIHESFKEHCSTEHMIVEAESGREAKEEQRLKYCGITQYVHTAKNIQKTTK